MIDLESSLWCSPEALLALFVSPMSVQCWNNVSIASLTWLDRVWIILVSVHAFFENPSKWTIKSFQERYYITHDSIIVIIKIRLIPFRSIVTILISLDGKRELYGQVIIYDLVDMHVCLFSFHFDEVLVNVFLALRIGFRWGHLFL